MLREILDSPKQRMIQKTILRDNESALFVEGVLFIEKFKEVIYGR